MSKNVRLENRAFIALWVGSVLLMLYSTSRAWTVTAVALTVILGVAYWWAQELSLGVMVDRERRYGWAQVGDLLEEQFTLANRAPVPALWVEIQDQSTLPGYKASLVVAIGGGATTRWRVEGVCQQRGVFNLGPWSVQMSDPFGLFQVTLAYPQVASFVVYPRVAHLPGIQLPRGEAPGSARHHERALADTTDAGGVRPHTSGDALRRVHWPTTARRRELFVKEFDLEPSGDLWILLDLDGTVQAGQGADSTEEMGVTIAASLTHAALAENRAVGLAISGKQPALLGPNKGRDQLWRVLRALAQGRAGAGPDLAELLRRVRVNVARGLTMAIITPACTPDWPVELLALQRRGVAATTILLDPVSFGGSSNAWAMRSLLADLGVGCQIVQHGMPLPPVFKVKPQGRPEYRIGATGRLIQVNGQR
ncbi:MAG: DUF58 domain-containing protein [Anaerolineae bacterium]